MPARAIEEDDVDAVVPTEALAGVLTALASGEALEHPASPATRDRVDPGVGPRS
jgi:hypothetical protein